MTNNGWHRTKHRLKYLVLDGMNGLSVVSKFQKIYTMYNKKKGCLKYTVKPIVCSKKMLDSPYNLFCLVSRGNIHIKPGVNLYLFFQSFFETNYLLKEKNRRLK